MKELNKREQQLLILEIAKAFAKVCDDNKIPYYMLGGTMLGAVRHGGFIPWDDDMDFGVPRKYYSILKHKLDEQLPDRYKCCTFENSTNICYGYYKIVDTFTRCNNAQFVSSEKDFLGLDLDIFPLDCCNKGDKMMKRVIWLNDKYGRIFTASATRSNLKNKIKQFLRFVFPFSKRQCYDYIEKAIMKIPKGDYWANIYGHWEEKEVIPIYWYGSNTMYKFEDAQFIGFKEYDLYLKQLYGDYMKLPPEEKRKGHSNNGVYLIKSHL